ncbi:MAG TPA: YetF domain-containing protein [Actinomycetota bacterium]|nr:YetF domain-containing protein [Actinomycetota bacterium]
MDSVLRALAVYVFLLVIFRVAGKRTMAQVTVFDFVLLLIISEATQQAMIGQDFSITNAILVITTLIAAERGLTWVQARYKKIDKLLDGLPLVLVEDGKPFEDRLRQERVGEDDILAAARQTQGLARMDQIKYAVLEQTGGISIVPKD